MSRSAYNLKKARKKFKLQIFFIIIFFIAVNIYFYFYPTDLFWIIIIWVVFGIAISIFIFFRWLVLYG